MAEFFLGPVDPPAQPLFTVRTFTTDGPDLMPYRSWTHCTSWGIESGFVVLYDEAHIKRAFKLEPEESYIETVQEVKHRSPVSDPDEEEPDGEAPDEDDTTYHQRHDREPRNEPVEEAVSA